MAAAIVFATVSAPTRACTVEAVPLSFGSINPLDRQAVDDATTVTVTCPDDTPYTISLSAGEGNYGLRHMSNGAEQLNYQVFTDAAQTMVWGDGSAGTAVVTGRAGSAGSAHPLYGRVPVQQSAVPGAYSDILLLTITY
ncbi:MAG: Spore coat protein [Xanthomonadaceae bacterium]|nr:Spore coat protein [Xanthomonadaceae bacterium]